jgi:hypothetical protein
LEVNPNRTPITSIARWHLAGPAGVILPQVVAALSPGQPGGEAPDA